ncbi:helix-turn-helix domain-containing protein [bacterium]|nr:helix-turn-helix domain-containing protein [bacterium]
MPKITSNEGKPYAEIGTLLRNLRLRRGMSQFDLADASGINNSYLSRIENGERRPSPKILKRFSEILQFPYDELVVTSGILSEDFVKSTPSETSGGDPTTQALQQLISGIQGKPAGSNGSSAAMAAAPRRAMPVYDTVPAGLLKDANVIEAHADIEKLVLSEDEMMYDPKSFGLIVQGDSMLEAGILDGDTLIVSPATQVSNGDIAVVQVNRRQTTVKKVYFENESVILQPANSNYRPQVLKYPDEVEILGKVVLVRRKLI